VTTREPEGLRAAMPGERLQQSGNRFSGNGGKLCSCSHARTMEGPKLRDVLKGAIMGIGGVTNGQMTAPIGVGVGSLVNSSAMPLCGLPSGSVRRITAVLIRCAYPGNSPRP
jgi:hypothetical protein